jgi:hypothetical protein
MSLSVESIEGPSVEVNLVPGEIFWARLSGDESLAKKESYEWMISISLGDKESLIPLESFCDLVVRYLSGGIFGWGGPTPDCVRETISVLNETLNKSGSE